ncbi:MAG: type II toxin-antitoxin system HipA family toxin [Burkholderiales bacterium]
MKRGALDVHVGNTRTGVLTRSAVRDAEFLFDYMTGTPAGAAVSLTMPIVPDQYDSMNTVHPAFEMSLPEGALRERLQRAFGKAVPNFDDLDLLGIVGGSQIGRLRYTDSGGALPAIPAQSIAELLTYRGTADLMEDLLKRFATSSGVSGMQPKVLVRDADALPRLTHRDTTHIVKTFDPRAYPELAANEFFCMRAAKSCGLPVPRVQLSANRQVLVVERFDLGPNGGYLGFEDFCVLNAMRAAGRYDSSYEMIARRITQYVSGDQLAQALEQFFMMVALSCAIGNGDAHLKNFGLLYSDPEASVWLAPAFDMVSTRVYMPRDSMALNLQESKGFPTQAALLKFAQLACQLSLRRARALLENVLDAVSRTRQEIRRFARTRPDFAGTAQALLSVFDQQATLLRDAK